MILRHYSWILLSSHFHLALSVVSLGVRGSLTYPKEPGGDNGGVCAWRHSPILPRVANIKKTLLNLLHSWISGVRPTRLIRDHAFAEHQCKMVSFMLIVFHTVGKSSGGSFFPPIDLFSSLTIHILHSTCSPPPFHLNSFSSLYFFLLNDSSLVAPRMLQTTVTIGWVVKLSAVFW